MGKRININKNGNTAITFAFSLSDEELHPFSICHHCGGRGRVWVFNEETGENKFVQLHYESPCKPRFDIFYGISSKPTTKEAKLNT